MKIVRFEHQGQRSVGVLRDDGIVDLGRHSAGLASLGDVLTPEGRAEAERISQAHPATLALDDVQLLVPVERSNRIFCVGVNYKSHAEETGRDLPPRPSVFTRTHESLALPGGAMLRPTVSTHFDFEGELVAVIGQPCRNVAEAQALEHVAGYCCFNDGSVRDYQKFSVTAGKNFDDSGSCGPWIVTSDEVPDPSALTLTTRLNGEEVQRSGTDLLIYSVPLIISYLSEITRLMPGDIVATGTPAGVGHRRNPQLWMKPGDVIEVEISGLGVLRNSIGQAA